MVYKRYEYYTKGGKTWSEWFEWNSTLREPWQLKNKLRNEYKEVDS